MNEKIKKFMELGQLMMPMFITANPIVEYAGNAATLEFQFAEEELIGYLMDQFDDAMELCLLYHSTEKRIANKHYCCFYAAPGNSSILYTINLVSDDIGYCHGLTATVYGDILDMQQQLQDEMERLADDDRYCVIHVIEEYEFMKTFLV